MPDHSKGALTAAAPITTASNIAVIFASSWLPIQPANRASSRRTYVACH
jgi:hypothetical protein